MTCLLAIADDLSGAAEIAGIGYRFGVPTRLLRERPADFNFAGLTVIDTDSRSLSAGEAAAVVERAVAGLWRAGMFDLLYKKTDSVFRGNIAAELGAIGRALNLPLAVLVAQNPSRGRTIAADGIYRIGGVPVGTSAFADDPDHPACSSHALDLLRGPTPRLLRPDEDFHEDFRGIVVGVATSAPDMARWAQRVALRSILPAGSGDFFAALLTSRNLRPTRLPIESLPADGRILFVCGSASAYARELTRRAEASGVAVCPMPDDVFAGAAPPAAWADHVAEALNRSPRSPRAPRALVVIPQPVDRSASQRLQSALAELAASVLERVAIANLMLEGGATASAVCRRMGWNAFVVTGEFAPGVVRLQAGGQILIIKPGSYPWPPSIW
jgi:uncharacterized protein YgbK (DUF1537 family)